MDSFINALRDVAANPLLLLGGTTVATKSSDKNGITNEKLDQVVEATRQIAKAAESVNALKQDEDSIEIDAMGSAKEAAKQAKMKNPMGMAKKAASQAKEKGAEPQAPDSLWDLSTKIIRGNYGNGEERKKALESEGYNYHQVQDFVNKRIYGTLKDSDYDREYWTAPTSTPAQQENPINEDYEKFMKAMRSSLSMLAKRGWPVAGMYPQMPNLGNGPVE